MSEDDSPQDEDVSEVEGNGSDGGEYVQDDEEKGDGEVVDDGKGSEGEDSAQLEKRQLGFLHVSFLSSSQ